MGNEKKRKLRRVNGSCRQPAWGETLVLPVLRGDPPMAWAPLTLTLKRRGILSLVMNTSHLVPVVIRKQEAAVLRGERVRAVPS